LEINRRIVFEGRKFDDVLLKCRACDAPLRGICPPIERASSDSALIKDCFREESGVSLVLWAAMTFCYSCAECPGQILELSNVFTCSAATAESVRIQSRE